VYYFPPGTYALGVSYEGIIDGMKASLSGGSVTLNPQNFEEGRKYKVNALVDRFNRRVSFRIDGEQ
jgi:hypothetical protein